MANPGFPRRGIRDLVRPARRAAEPSARRAPAGPGVPRDQACGGLAGRPTRAAGDPCAQAPMGVPGSV